MQLVCVGFQRTRFLVRYVASNIGARVAIAFEKCTRKSFGGWRRKGRRGGHEIYLSYEIGNSKMCNKATSSLAISFFFLGPS